MDNRNNGFAPLLILLSQMLKNSGQAEVPRKNPQFRGPDVSGVGADAGVSYFARDETESCWRREENVDLLVPFCREGFAMARKYGHFLVGTGTAGTFLAIPGRFLLEEQPAGGMTGFTLWQPLAGGEELYENLEQLDGGTAESVYGYWIAGLDPETLKLSEV